MTLESLKVTSSRDIADAFPLSRNVEAMRTDCPFISIIMPVRNEEQAISSVLESLLSQDYPCERMEIIVADGMSSDETRSLVARAAVRDSRIRLVDNPRRIMAAGFNAGLRVARGDILVMMGGHTELSAGYLSVCASLLEEGLADCVGGSIRTVGHARIGRAISLALSSRFGVGGVAFRTDCREPKYVDTVAFGAYTRKIIERAGPLDEEFVRGQDDEFNYRVRKLGGRILIAPELKSSYTSRSSLPALWRQYFRYGFWKVRVLQKHPLQMQIRQFVPAVFVSSLLILLVTAAIRPAIGLPVLLFLAASYLGFSFLVSAYLACVQHEWWFAPLLTLTFPVLHFSYGVGFLSGLVKFRNRWH